MNVVTIAAKSMRQRALASSLTALSVALGVALMVTVLVIHGVVSLMFNQSASGFHLIVGAKGSPLQLVLNTVYFMDRPINNVPYWYYQQLQRNNFVKAAIPFALGDTTPDGKYRVAGTVPEYFQLEYVPGKKFALAQGSFIKEPFDAVLGAKVARDYNWPAGHFFPLAHGGKTDDLHSETPFRVVGTLQPTGTPIDRAVFVHLEGFYLMPGHEKPEKEAQERDQLLKGVREGTLGLPGQKKPPPPPSGAEAPPPAPPLPATEAPRAESPQYEPPRVIEHPNGRKLVAIPENRKEVTAILLLLEDDMTAYVLQAGINRRPVAQAVNPIMQISQLLNGLVGNVRTMLLVLTALIIFVSGIGIFVSIYNSMSDRKREIAVMRALGARRLTVFGIIISESLLLCLGGGLLGFLLGHGLVFVAGPIVEARSDVLIDPWFFDTYELYIIPALLVLAFVVGVLPGLSAYRTDVAKSLHG